jgi:hypothetical protein
MTRAGVILLLSGVVLAACGANGAPESRIDVGGSVTVGVAGKL